MNRYESKESKLEIIDSLKDIFPIESVTDISKEDATEALSLTESKREGGQHLFWSQKYNAIICIMYDIQKVREVFRGFSLQVVNKPQAIDLAFGNYFCKVFNDDIKLLPSQVSHTELWVSLRQTHFRRAIAKFSAFGTEPMIKWLQIIENSVNLKYENKPFPLCLFMTKQKEWIQKPLGNRFVDFSQPMPFERGILHEKWLRGAMSGQSIGLAGYGHAGELFGIFAIPDTSENDTDCFLSPHEDIVSIINLLVEGTCMFLTTVNGDIYLILPNRAIFYKSQARWHYLNFTNIHKTLSSLFAESVAAALLRLALNLAFERQGALIFVPDNPSTLIEIIPDYGNKNQVNKTLRKAITGLDITDKVQRNIIASSAKVDGALVVSSEGKVLDVACMIGQPPQSLLDKLGIRKLERFSGARSTATWNASIYGTAIKVSEDGPITIFRQGKVIAQMG